MSKLVSFSVMSLSELMSCLPEEAHSHPSPPTQARRLTPGAPPDLVAQNCHRKGLGPASGSQGQTPLRRYGSCIRGFCFAHFHAPPCSFRMSCGNLLESASSVSSLLQLAGYAESAFARMSAPTSPGVAMDFDEVTSFAAICVAILLDVFHSDAQVLSSVLARRWLFIL